MKSTQLVVALVLCAFVGSAAAGSSHVYKNHKRGHGLDHYDYARVIKVEPLYREVRVSEPVRECWEEPVYHTRHEHSHSAGGMLAGGIIGGIIGHQIGKGRGKRVATAVGTLVGAQIGHEAVKGDRKHSSSQVVEYEQHCKTHHRVRYEEVVDAYEVTYKYQGKRYQIEMPYDPGKRLKMRIQVTPVF